MSSRTATRTQLTLAETLIQAREKAGLEMAAVSEKLKVPEEKLAAFERGDYTNLPDDVYTRIMLKAYAAVLGLEPGSVTKIYARERNTARKTATTAERRWRRHPAEAVPSSQLAVLPRVIRGLVAAALVLALAGYLAMEVKALMTPPAVTLMSPDDGVITRVTSIVVDGSTEPEASVIVSGKEVTPDVNGHFSDTIQLQDGMNVITVTAKKKHSREMTVTRHIILDSPDKPAAFAPLDSFRQ